MLSKNQVATSISIYLHTTHTYWHTHILIIITVYLVCKFNKCLKKNIKKREEEKYGTVHQWDKRKPPQQNQWGSILYI